MLDPDDYRVAPGEAAALRSRRSDDDGGMQRDVAESKFEELHERLVHLAEKLYADHSRSLLVVLQGMDTSGKDSTIRAVFSGCTPTGLRAVSFKQPSTLERSHDFLWRVHAQAPARGEIAIWNRSHYEDVLIVRVRRLAPKGVWQERYEHINAFERLLHAEGTCVVKLFLHISKAYQKERLEKRLADAAKHWKFDPNDLEERKRWADYLRAYEDALSRCSTKHAPWYVIPAEKRWFRNLLVTRVLVHSLESLRLKYPKPAFDAAKLRVT